MSKEEAKKEQDPKTAEPSYELPKSGFFRQGNIRKFAEHYGLFDTEPGAAGKPPLKDATKAPAKAKEDEECPDCPKGTAKKATAPAPAKEPPADRKPFRILKVNGKDHPVYSQEEYDNLAQQGVDYSSKRQRDKDWEKDLQTTEDRLAKLAEPLTKLSEIVERGGRLPGITQDEEEHPDDNTIDESLIDPAVKKRMETQEKKIKDLEGIVSQGVAERNISKAQEATKALDQIVVKSREEFPFTEEIKDGEDNVVQHMFAGMVAAAVNREAIQKRMDPYFQPRPLPEVIRDSARRMNLMEKHYEKRFGETPKITPETLKKDNPDLYREIGEDYVAAQKKETSDLPPRVQATNREVNSNPNLPGQKTGKPKTLKEQIDLGLSDPEIKDGLDKMGQVKYYGLK